MSTATYLSADPYEDYEDASDSEFSTHTYEEVYPTRVEVVGDVTYTIVCLQSDVPFNGFYGGRNSFQATRFFGVLERDGVLRNAQRTEVSDMLTQIVNGTPTPRLFRWAFIRGFQGMTVVNALRWAFPSIADARIAYLYRPETQFEFYAIEPGVFAALQVGTYV